MDSEKQIVELINSDSRFKEIILKCLNKLDCKFTNNIKAIIDKSTKSDISLTENSIKVGISVKSSSKTSFHQLDRRTLDNWKRTIDIPDEIFDTLKNSILRVSENSRKNRFIVEEDQDKIGKFFLENIEGLLREIFTRNEPNLKLFLINNKMERKIFICDMDEALEFLINNASKNFSFSKKGIIKLGNFISVQRKGGNGKRIKVPKTAWEHPGNNLQFKFKPLDFANAVEKSKIIKSCIINY